MTMLGFSNTLFVLVKNCKLAVLDLVGSGEWFLQFTKFCMAKVFVDVYFLCCLFKAIFKALGGRSKKEDDQFFSYFFRSCLRKTVHYFVLAIIFFNIHQIQGTLSSILIFKKHNKLLVLKSHDNVSWLDATFPQQRKNGNILKKRGN
jgi:hypothetical protein